MEAHVVLNIDDDTPMDSYGSFLFVMLHKPRHGVLAIPMNTHGFWRAENFMKTYGFEDLVMFSMKTYGF